MSTYGQLKSDIARELAREDLSADIPRFVTQASQRINREPKLRVSEMERRARAFGNGTRYLASPMDFLEMRRMWNVITSGTQERHRETRIQQVAPQALKVRTAGGRLPSQFVVTRGDPPELEFDVPLADDREVEMVYLLRYAPFVADSDTNWLLSNHYGVYLHAALIEASLFIRHDERAPVWATAYSTEVDEIYRTQRRRHYMQPMRTRAAQPVF